MTLLRPGLWGIAVGVLAVPILIHLWSRRPARVVSIGSTRLLTGAKPSQARRLALTDLPLLALRLLILALAGLILLGASWRSSTSVPRRIALITAGSTARADSLAAAGWSVHWLQPGLPADASNAPATDAPVPLWSLLRDAVRLFPATDSVLVMAPVTAASLDGARPALPFGVRISALGGTAARRTDTLALCLENAAAASPDGQRLRAALQSIGEAAGAATRLLEQPCAASRAPGLVLRVGAGMLGRAPRERETGLWPLDPAALRDPAIIDALSAVLDVRRTERGSIVMAPAAALPGVAPAGTHDTAASWHLPLALAALVLLTAERLLAARRRGASGA